MEEPKSSISSHRKANGDSLNFCSSQSAKNKLKLEECEPVDDSQDNDRCQFQAVYNDLQIHEKFCIWHCDEKRRKSRPNEECIFCVFHDKTQTCWNKETFEKFERKIKDHGASKQRLFCIGYYFPMNISFNRRSRDEKTADYDYPVYLCDAEFAGSVDFSRCNFKESLNLSGAIFRRQALFRYSTFEEQFYPRNTKFLENVNFRRARFCNADFHDTVFEDKANFHDAEFHGNKTRFLDVRFQGKANFEHTKFTGETVFWGTSFRQTEFSPDTMFEGITKFRYVVFEVGEKVHFGVKDLSHVSFLNTDITRVNFPEDVNWGGEDSLTVIDERYRELEPKKLRQYSDKRYLFKLDKVSTDEKHNERLRDFLKTRLNLIDFNIEKDANQRITIKNIKMKNEKDEMSTGCIEVDYGKGKAVLNIGGKIYYEFYVKDKKAYSIEYPTIDSIKAIYRNLRENYEYRLRYEKAGKFFTREMELKRKYREAPSPSPLMVKLMTLFKLKWDKCPAPEVVYHLKANRRLIRDFSLIGLYYHLSRYGESIFIPIIIGTIIVSVSTLFWLVQNNPTGEPFIPYLTNKETIANTSTQNFINFNQISNNTHIVKAFERSLVDFLPLLSMPSDTKIGIIDFIVKIIGGGLTFVLLGVALRRKFERRFRH